MTYMVSTEKFKIFDYDENKRVELMLAIALKAKKELSSWPGTIKEGPEVALSILENQVSACVRHQEKILMLIRAIILNVSHAVWVDMPTKNQPKVMPCMEWELDT